jgi:DNA-binding CsgD family transcriptional regulator
LIITVFKNRFVDEERQATQRAVREELAIEADDRAGERVHRTACSEASLRAAAGPLWEPVPLLRGVQRIASMLDEGLTDDERDILTWVSEHMLQSQIAEWLGVSYPTARKRLERLRARLAEVAERFRHSLSGRDRRDVDRFFERFDAVLGDRRPPPSGGARAIGDE